jgi:uncharacterized protein YdaU (DUF1376 family)
MSEKKKRLHWMPLDWPAYWADTRGFDAEKHGAYLMLLGELWMKKGLLRADDPDLAGLAACTPERWAAVGPSILAKFTVVEGLLVQKRLDAEFEHAQKVSAARAAAGAAGAAKRWQGDGKEMANAKKTMAKGKQNDRHKHKHKHSPNGESLGASDDAPGVPPAQPPGNGYSEDFEAAWAIYPKRMGGNSKMGAYKAWNARLEAGATPEVLKAGTARYGLFCKADNKVGTRYVMQAATFFGPDFHFLEAWTPPATPPPTNRHEDRARTMSGLGSKQGHQHGQQPETDRADSPDTFDVSARVISDAG